MRRSSSLRASAFVVLASAVAGGFAACGGDVFTSAKTDGGGAATDGALVDGSGGGDGGLTDGSSRVDGAPTSGPCAPSKPFTTLTHLPTGVNSDVSETSFRTSPEDLLALVVRSHQALYQFVRGSTAVDFSGNGAPIDAGGDVDHLTVTGDGSRVYFVSTRTGSSTGLWTAARDATTGALSSVTAVTVLPMTVNTLPDTLTDPYVTRDGKELLFSGKNGSGNDDIWIADLVSVPTFGNARPLTSVNTSYDEGDPVLSDDGLALYWAVTNSADVVSLATRTSTANDTFVVQPFPGGGVNVGAGVADTPMAISPDQCELYILSDRAGSLGGKDVWRATR